MTSSYSLIAAAVAASLAAGAQAQSAPEFKFSGYGTVGAVHSGEKSADFVADVFQPDGAGATRSTSFKPDSKLAVQADARFGEAWSAVVQVVSKYQYDGSYRPAVEWANVKFRPTASLDLRVGRVALPTSLLAESRLVGYASPWVRPPQEVYSMSAITTSDGVDAAWRSQFGGANNTLQAYYGVSESKLKNNGKVKSKGSWGINDSVEMGSWQLRAGYNTAKVDLVTPQLDPLYKGLAQLAAGAAAVPAPSFQAAAGQLNALIDTYKLTDIQQSTLALGLSYDPGNWFVMSEFIDYKSDSILANSRSWYVGAGLRLGTFTPYVSYQTTKARVKHAAAITATGAAAVDGGATALVAGLNTALRSTAATQDSVSLGVRWDFMKNVAAKAQFDRVHVGEGSTGRLLVPAGGTLSNRNVNVLSLAVDFVF